MVRKFGDEKATWALGITGLVVAMPVFFDAGLIILIPLAFSLAKRTKRSVLYYVIPLLADLAVGHAFIPPTPGPVLVATMLGVDLGWVILIGIFCGVLRHMLQNSGLGDVIGNTVANAGRRRGLPRGTDHLFLCLTDDLILFQVVVPCSPNSFTF